MSGGGLATSSITLGAARDETRLRFVYEHVTVTSDTTPYNNLQTEPALCVNSNPRPDCGMKPQASGDRGGWMQYTVFFVMLAGVGVLGTVLVRNVIRRDRAIAEQMESSD